MTDLLVAVVSAFWLGILTSISPCPLATNIAAISYVGRKVTSTSKVFLTGLLYTIGRMVVYTVLGVILISSILSAFQLSIFLQTNLNKFLGPILIIVGMILIKIIRINFFGFGISEKIQGKIDAMGMGGALLLGMLFALSFCPVSAALFFGSLMPIAVKIQSPIIVPSAYGAATGLPVLFFTMLLTTGIHRVARIHERLVRAELWARRITGIIFILVGIYYSLIYIFGIFT